MLNMLDKVKNAIYQGLEEKFAIAAVNEMTGDYEGYRDSLIEIGAIAEILGIDTEITVSTLCLIDGE